MGVGRRESGAVNRFTLWATGAVLASERFCTALSTGDFHRT